MVETEAEAADGTDGDDSRQDVGEKSDTGLILAGTALGVAIGIGIAVATGEMKLGLSVSLALGIVIPSGIRGHRRQN